MTYMKVMALLFWVVYCSYSNLWILCVIQIYIYMYMPELIPLGGEPSGSREHLCPHTHCRQRENRLRGLQMKV